MTPARKLRGVVQSEAARHLLELVPAAIAIGLIFWRLQFSTRSICCGDYDGYYHIMWSRLLWESFHSHHLKPTFIWLPLTTLNPRDYVAAPKVKMELYRRLSRLPTLERLADFHQELLDRFGDTGRDVPLDALMNNAAGNFLARTEELRELDHQRARPAFRRALRARQIHEHSPHGRKSFAQHRFCPAQSLHCPRPDPAPRTHPM